MEARDIRPSSAGASTDWTVRAPRPRPLGEGGGGGGQGESGHLVACELAIEK